MQEFKLKNQGIIAALDGSGHVGHSCRIHKTCSETVFMSLVSKKLFWLISISLDGFWLSQTQQVSRLMVCLASLMESSSLNPCWSLHGRRILSQRFFAIFRSITCSPLTPNTLSRTEQRVSIRQGYSLRSRSKLLLKDRYTDFTTSGPKSSSNVLSIAWHRISLKLLVVPGRKEI